MVLITCIINVREKSRLLDYAKNNAFSNRANGEHGYFNQQGSTDNISSYS